MHSQFQQAVRVLTAAVLAWALAVPQAFAAQTPQHLVSPQDLAKAAQDATHARQLNLDTLRSFLSSAKAQKALESARMNPQKVQNAVSGLSNDELAQLSSRATRAQNEFAAGSMDNRDLLIIILAIAALILIIVAVH